MKTNFFVRLRDALTPGEAEEESIFARMTSVKSLFAFLVFVIILSYAGMSKEQVAIVCLALFVLLIALVLIELGEETAKGLLSLVVSFALRNRKDEEKRIEAETLTALDLFLGTLDAEHAKRYREAIGAKVRYHYSAWKIAGRDGTPFRKALVRAAVRERYYNHIPRMFGGFAVMFGGFMVAILLAAAFDSFPIMFLGFAPTVISMLFMERGARKAIRAAEEKQE